MAGHSVESSRVEWRGKASLPESGLGWTCVNANAGESSRLQSDFSYEASEFFLTPLSTLQTGGYPFPTAGRLQSPDLRSLIGCSLLLRDRCECWAPASLFATNSNGPPSPSSSSPLLQASRRLSQPPAARRIAITVVQSFGETSPHEVSLRTGPGQLSNRARILHPQTQSLPDQSQALITLLDPIVPVCFREP